MCCVCPWGALSFYSCWGFLLSWLPEARGYCPRTLEALVFLKGGCCPQAGAYAITCSTSQGLEPKPIQDFSHPNGTSEPGQIDRKFCANVDVMVTMEFNIGLSASLSWETLDVNIFKSFIFSLLVSLGNPLQSSCPGNLGSPLSIPFAI